MGIQHDREGPVITSLAETEILYSENLLLKSE